MKQKFMFFVIFLAVTHFTLNESSFAKDSPDCAKLKTVKGTNCKDLNAEFDLSDCAGSGDDAVKPEIQCEGDIARVSTKSGGFLYRGYVEKKENKWIASGPVVRTPYKKLEAPQLHAGPAPQVAHEEKHEAKAVEKKEIEIEKPHEVAMPPVANPGAIQWGAYLDTYYSYNFNRPDPVARTTGFPSGNNQVRSPDIYHNQVSLNLFEISVKKTGEQVNFTGELDFGHQADVDSGVQAANGSVTQTSEVAKHIGLTYLTYTPKKYPKFSFEIGKLPSHIGYEEHKSKDRWNYSHSTMATFAEPTWHTGVHAEYRMRSDQIVVGLYGYNSTGTIFDYNSGKLYGAQVRWVPSQKWAFVYNFLQGPERDSDNQHLKTFHNVIIAANPGKKWSFALEGLHGREHQVITPTSQVDANWTGGAGYAKYQPNEDYFVAARGSMLHDTHGYILFAEPAMHHDFTLTQGLDLGDGLNLRLEGRYDYSTSKVRFVKGHGVNAHEQTTVTLGFLYSL